MEDHADDVLSRLFGVDLQSATLRLVLYLVVASAVVATIAVLI